MRLVDFFKSHVCDTVHALYLEANTRGPMIAELTRLRLPTETGMARLSLNDDDKKVRDWLYREAEALGFTVTVDQMGNMFAVRPGKAKDAAPVMMGSHLDTQPTGGRYDGILGVMAALEVLRTLDDNKWETQGPVGLVNWTK